MYSFWEHWRFPPQLQEIMNKHSDVRLKQQTCCQLANTTVSKSKNLWCVAAGYFNSEVSLQEDLLDRTVQYINTDNKQINWFFSMLQPLLTVSQ